MTALATPREPRLVVFRVFYWTFVCYLFAPLLLIVLMSLKDSPFVGFPIRGFTLHWYTDLAGDRDVGRALLLSLGVGLAATVLAIVVGTWIALALFNLPWQRLAPILFGAACIPLVTPGIISAISMRMFIRLIGIEPGAAAITLSHAAHAAPLVVIMVITRLRLMPKSLVEAAQDLGADAKTAFRRVVLPFIMPAIVASGMLAMLTSFDDFIRSFFLGSFQPTLPVLIFAKIRDEFSPAITALATVVLVISALLGLAAERQTRKVAER